MAEEASFQDLIRRIRAGDNDAAAEIVRRYEPAVRRVARIRLAEAHLQRTLDSVDICQSVFASFFVRAAMGQFDLSKPEDVLSLLVSMSRRKVIDQARGAGAARRDYRRLEGGAPEERQVPASDPSPSQQVSAAELIQEFRRRLTAEERRLVDCRSEGHNWNQIAQECGGSAEALRKQYTRAVERVAAELGLDEAP
jgi:RNA polymerase sigma-70 factor (ECF subfamily)